MRRHTNASSAGSTSVAGWRPSRSTRGVLGALLPLALLFGVLVSSASAVRLYEPRSFSPITGAGIGTTLHGPSGIAVDQETGNVFVNDGAGANVTDVFGVEGGHPTGVGSPYQISGFAFQGEPSGVAIDNSPTSSAKGTLYVVDVIHSAVKKFTLNSTTEQYEPSGQLLTSSGPAFSEPLGDVVDDEGNVFVADYGSSSVVEFNPAGSQVARISTAGSVDRPSSVAVASNGDLFVQGYGGEVAEYPANGSGQIEAGVFTKIVNGGATGVAVDDASNALFIAMGNHAAKYNATTLSPEVEFGAGLLGETGRLAVNSATGSVYVADRSNARVAVFGEGVILPGVEAHAPTDLTGVSVTLNGAVNPEGVAVEDCHFEYGATASSYDTTVPCDGTITPDSNDHEVSAAVEGLEPHKTYHYRLVASNANGTNRTPDQTLLTRGPALESAWTASVDRTSATLQAEVRPEGDPTTFRVDYGTTPAYGLTTGERGVGSDETTHTVSITLTQLEPGTTYHWKIVTTNSQGTVESADQAFTTFSLPGEAPECPNATLRSGASAALPDCRAFEMVSPVEKNNGDIKAVCNTFCYRTSLNQSSLDGNKLTFSSYKAFGNQPSNPFSNQYLATRTAAGWNVDGIDPPRDSMFHGGFSEEWDLEIQFKAFSPDLSTAWLTNSNDEPLSTDGTTGIVNLYKRDNATDTYHAITINQSGTPYEGPPEIGLRLEGHSGDGSHTVFSANMALTPDAPNNGERKLYDFHDGQIELVSVLPDGTPSLEGSQVGSGHILAKTVHGEMQLEHAVSDDGSKIFWTSHAEAAPSPLFVHIEGQGTTEISAEPVVFRTASSDGSKVFFEAEEGDGYRKLYEYDLESEVTRLIAGEAAGVVGTSEDGSYVYFVSKEELAVGSNAAQQNLYLEHEGSVTFIARLADADVGEASEGRINLVARQPINRASYVTPDGKHIAFQSIRSLTGYDNTDAARALPDIEVFTYGADSQQLVCASCNPSGARPAGAALRIPYTASDEHVGPNVWAAAWLNTPETSFYAPKSLSDDGSQLFFNSFDSLLPQDSNGQQDVYEWRAGGTGDCERAEGCVSLISTGESPQRSEFIDADPKGENVFFDTSSSLVPQDDGLVDIYDARRNGGIPQPPAPAAACEGEACQSPPSPPSDPTPSSSTFKGAGNLKPQSTRQRAHKKKHVKKKHSKRKQRANHQRRAGR